MKAALKLLGLAAIIVVVTWWAVGPMEFTRVTFVPNDPLRHPRRVKELNGTNLVLESGQIIGLDPRFASHTGLSNKLYRSDFQVDIEEGETNAFSLSENEEGNTNRLDLYVRSPRRRDEVRPGLLIPLFRKTAGENYRAWVASGRYVALKSQPSGAADRIQPSRSETNRASSAAGSGG